MKLKYSINAVKTGIGHDLAGYNCNLLKDGKKVAIVDDDGYGGGVMYHWIKPEYEQEFKDFIKALSKTEIPKGKDSEFYKDYDSMGMKDCENNRLSLQLGLDCAMDCFIEYLIILKDREKDFKRACRKNVAFQVGEDIGTDRFLTIKGFKYKKDTFDKWASKHYPDQKILVFNEKYNIGVIKNV